MRETHFHFIVWAFDEYDPENGTCKNNVTIDLIADTEQDALDRASTILNKPNYRVHSVIEHFDGACK